MSVCSFYPMGGGKVNSAWGKMNIVKTILQKQKKRNLSTFTHLIHNLKNSHTFYIIHFLHFKFIMPSTIESWLSENL